MCVSLFWTGSLCSPDLAQQQLGWSPAPPCCSEYDEVGIHLSCYILLGVKDRIYF